jgi:hypothetical protein
MNRLHPYYRVVGVVFRRAFQQSQAAITMDLEISSDATFEELWKQALDSYFSSLNRSLEDKVALKRIHNADDLFN